MNKIDKENQFTFPPKEEFERVIKRAQKSDKRTNFLLPPNATIAEKSKYQLCKNIARFERENNLSEKVLAEKLGINHQQLEKILFCHIYELNLEELTNLTEKLELSSEKKSNSKQPINNLENTLREHAWEKTSPKTH